MAVWWYQRPSHDISKRVAESSSDTPRMARAEANSTIPDRAVRFGSGHPGRVTATFRNPLRYVVGRPLVPPDRHLPNVARLEPAPGPDAQLHPLSAGLRPVLCQRSLVFFVGPISVFTAYRMGQAGAL